MTTKIENIKHEQINTISKIEKDKQKRREIEKIIDDNLSKAIETNFPDDKEISKYLKGKRFDINGSDFSELQQYLQGKVKLEKGDNRPYLDFLQDLTEFKNHVNEIQTNKSKEQKNASDILGATAKEHKDSINQSIDTYKNTFGFLIDTNNKIDDLDNGKNLKKFKNADAQAFGGDRYLLSRMGDFYTRFGEEKFTELVVKNFNNYLKGKGLAEIQGIKNLKELEANFIDANKKAVEIETDKKLDGKNKKQKISVTELFVDSISPFTGNLDRYFGIKNNINEAIKSQNINDLLKPENIKIAIEDLAKTNPEEFDKRLKEFEELFQTQIKPELEKQKKSAKTKEEKQTIKEFLKDPSKLFFNGISLGYIKHTQDTTLQHLNKQGEFVRADKGKVAVDVFSAGASAGLQIAKNLSLIFGGNANYVGGKIIPGVSAGINQNLGKGFAVGVNAGMLLGNNKAFGALLGLSKRINIKNGAKDGKANLDLNIYAGADLLKDFAPNVGVNLDRNKMLGVANFLLNLREGLNDNIYNGLKEGEITEAKLISGLTTDKGSYIGIDKNLAIEITKDVLPLLSTYNKLDSENGEYKKEILNKIYIQNNITDNIIVHLASKKYQSTGTFGRGGISFSTNDIATLGLPFVYRVLGGGIKKSNVYTKVSEQQRSIISESNEKIGSDTINKLNEFFGRKGENSFSEENGIITVPKDIKITLNNKQIEGQTIDTREYNIVIKGGSIEITPVNKNAIDKKYIDILVLSKDDFISKYFDVKEDKDSIIFVSKTGGESKTKVSKQEIKTNGLVIDTREFSFVTNPDTNKQPGKIEKIIYKDGEPKIIDIKLPLSEGYNKNFLDKILSDYKKTLDGQKITREIKYANSKTYELFSAEMKKENTDYAKAAQYANAIIASYNSKFPTNKIDFKFDSQNKNDLLNFFVALISYDYAVGKVNNEKFDEGLNSLINGIDAKTKAKVQEIINKNSSLSDEDLARAKASLFPKHKDIYLKLLTVRDIATKSVFNIGNGWIRSRENIITGDSRGFGNRMVYYTNKSLDNKIDGQKTVGDLRNYESEIVPIGFVLGYPGEKLAANLEVIKGSKVEIGNTEEDKLLRKYAFESLIKTHPEYKDIDLSKAKINENGDLEIDKDTRVSADKLEFALYAHCNGNHCILAPGFKIIKQEQTTEKQELLTGFGDISLSDREFITRMEGASKNILGLYVGQILTKVVTTIKTENKDQSGNTFDKSIIGKEIKVNVDGVEKTVKVIDMGNGKLQMAVVGGGSAEIYTLTPDTKGTINIGGTLYSATKVVAGNVSSGTANGFPGSSTPTTVPATITSVKGQNTSGGSTEGTFGNAGESRGKLNINTEKYIVNPQLLIQAINELQKKGVINKDIAKIIEQRIEKK